MPPINILVYEDNAVEQLYPVSTGRPAYAITCGSYQLIDWLTQLSDNVVGAVRPHLELLQTLDYPRLSHQLDLNRPCTMVVNARAIPTVRNYEHLVRLARQPMEQDQIHVERDGWSVAAAVLPTSILADSRQGHLATTIGQICSAQGIKSTDTRLGLFQYPHDVIRANLEHFVHNIGYRIDHGDYREIADNVFVGPETRFSDHVVTDTSSGPIVIDRSTSIGPFCLLQGPIYVGPNSRVNEHTSVKDSTSLAHTTKIGGEIEGCVIEAYTNKQHHGFLGHSYLGSWINLGAGTCNSDLKNTYGPVNMIYGGEKVPTGMQFVGCIMGDYAKTAINTGIFTGKVIGACSMVYGFVTTNVPSFVNYARFFGQVTELPPSVMISTQKRMFNRRNVEQRPVDVQLLKEMYELTRRERQLSEEPLML